jgi:hypothetical protein
MDLHHNIEALTFTVIEHSKVNELYTLYMTTGESINNLTVTTKVFNYQLAAMRELEQFIEGQVNAGFSIADELSTLNDREVSLHRNISPTALTFTDQDELAENSVLMPQQKGEAATLYIDVFTNTCQITRYNGHIVKLSNSVSKTLFSCLDGFFVSSLLINVTVNGEDICLLDFIQVNEHSCDKFVFYKWLQTQLTTHELIHICPIKKAKKGLLIKNCFDLFPGEDVLTLTGALSSTENTSKVITLKSTINLIVTNHSQAMISLGFLDGKQLVSCCLLPKNNLSVSYMDVVCVIVNENPVKLSFVRVIALCGPNVSIDTCTNPYALNSVKTALKQVKSNTFFDDNNNFSKSS